MLSLATLWVLFLVPLVVVGNGSRGAAHPWSPGSDRLVGLVCCCGSGTSFVPIGEFHVVTNIRCGLLLLVSVVFLLYAGIMTRDTSGKGWRSDILHYGWIVLLFILCTAETVDFFRHRASCSGAAVQTNLRLCGS